MNVMVAARQFSLTPAIEQFVREQVAPLDRGEERVHVILTKERFLFRAELVLHVRHLPVRVEGRAKDMYAAVRDAVHKCERALAHRLGKLATAAKRARRRTGRSSAGRSAPRS